MGIDLIPRKYKLHLTGGGLFHDTRKDVILLAKIVNLQHDKINELIDEVKYTFGGCIISVDESESYITIDWS